MSGLSRSTNSLVNDLRTAALASLAGRGGSVGTSTRRPPREDDNTELATKRRKFSPIAVRRRLGVQILALGSALHTAQPQHASEGGHPFEHPT